MKILWASFVVCLTTLCACSSISKKQNLSPLTWPPLAWTPDERPAADFVASLESELKNHPSDSLRFQVRYLEARALAATEPDRACLIWIALADEPRFPIPMVAKQNALEFCPATPTTAMITERPDIAFRLKEFAQIQPDTQPHWLKQKSIRAGLAMASRQHAMDSRADDVTSREIQLSLEVVPFTHGQSEQMALINHAIELARRLGNKTAENLAREMLWKVAPRTIPDPTPDKYAAVAADFRRARDFEKAREYYQKDFNRPEYGVFDKLRALDGIRMSYKIEGNKEKYLSTTREYSDYARDRLLSDRNGRKRKSGTERDGYIEKYVETRITLARAIWNDNSPSDAKKVLDRLQREIKSRKHSAKILFLRARIEEEAGNLELATKLLAQIDEKSTSDRSEKLKILWYRAWMLRKLKKSDQAVALLHRSIDEETSPSTLARDHFWLGRILKEEGDNQAAEAEFNWLTANDPMGYYGLLGYRELGRDLPALAVLPPPSQAGLESIGGTNDSVERNALSNDERMTFEWLVGTGETDLARGYLDQFDSARRATFNDDQLLDFLRLYAKTGSYQALFERISELSPDRRMQILIKQPELIFPRPWPDLVQKNADKFGVPKELVYSIIRQESSFNPRARSIADAFGLMQLLPASASRASQSTGIHIDSPDELYRPDTNIPLGTAFFRNILDKWNGKFIPAVASYNANEIAVGRWLKTRDIKDSLQFIEDIPYEETRGYVKLVLRNFIFYSRLNSVASQVAFPEWCLVGLQDVKP